MRSALVLVLFLASCASSTTTPPAPTQCVKKLTGNYMVEYALVSGTCVAPPSTIVSVDAPSPGCTTVSEVFSEGDCKSDSKVECTTASGQVQTITGTLRSKDANATRVEGIMTIRVAGGCTGTFNVTYTKQ